MLTYRTGAAGSPSSAVAMATYLMEATVPTAEAQLAAYYAQDRGSEEGLVLGMGTTPMPRRDMHPDIAKALGISADRALTNAEFTNLLMGKRTDGADWPGAPRAQGYKAETNEDGVAIGKDRVSISYVDLTLSAPKSVSVAWAFALEAERHSIAQAHRSARDQTLAYIEQQIARKGFGKGHTEGEEAGHLAWITCDHYTGRPTLSVVQTDPTTGVTDTELYTVPGNHIAGDPQLHSHTIVPNLMVTESGRTVAVNRDLLHDRVHEFGAVYQAILATELRAIGMDAVLDERTLMAKLPAVPDQVAEAFSKRTRDAEGVARDQAKKEGFDWDAMSGQEQVRFLKSGAARTRQQKAELADAFAWREQAKALNYDPQSFQAYGPVRPAMTRAERLAAATATTLPLFEDELTKRAVVTGGDARLAAARGLINWGIEGTSDVDAITRGMVANGVVQDGARTGLIWRVDPRGRVKITTTLHKAQEEELIARAKAAAVDTRLALSPKAIAAAVERTGWDFSGEHGEAQRNALGMLGGQGSLAVMIASAGAGKTTAVLSPLVNAWQHAGNEVWGTALAWRQARDLSGSGIERSHCRAMQPFLDAVGSGYIKLHDKSVIVLDEVGQIGTRQLLDLLRLREESGAKIVAMGDDRQCQSIEAGPVIELLRQALGPEAIPEILTTVRQRTEEERRIAGQFRRGEVAQAVAAKRANGTAELVEGGYRQAVHRVADLYAERRRENPDFTVTISAPTNTDAREISRAVREIRRAQGEVGPDRITVTASDGRGESYPLRLAEGDRVRLFQRTRAVFTDQNGRLKSANIGDNGTVLLVEAVVPGRGLNLRTNAGKVGFVGWADLKHRGSDHGSPPKVALTYGDCGTIDSSQGITSDEHIHAFPSGSQGVPGFKNYVAQTRHRVRSFMVGSMGAEMRGAMASRPLGLPEPEGRAASDEAWAHVVKNFGRTPVKESALAMLQTLTTGRRRAAEALQSGLRKRERLTAKGLRSGLSARLRRVRAKLVVEHVVRTVAAAAPAKQETVAKLRAAVPPPRRRTRVKVSKVDAQMQLAQFMKDHGLQLAEAPILDGKRRYVQVDGNKGSERSGAYMAFYEGVVPAGVVWNYKTSVKVNWKADGEVVPVSTAERRAIEQRTESTRAARAREAHIREEKGAQRARAILDASVPADLQHPYLVAKGIAAHDLRQNAAGNLIVPLRTADGQLRNLQTIAANGEKRLLPGAKKLGTAFVLGNIRPGEPLFVAEGFATAATIHEATGAAVAVAIDTSNLGAAARTLRQAHPDARIVMAADNDVHLPLRPPPRNLPNAGVKKATEVAQEIGAAMAAPDAIPERTAADKGTDWNDLAATYGKDAVRDALRQQLQDTPAKVHAEQRSGPRLSMK